MMLQKLMVARLISPLSAARQVFYAHVDTSVGSLVSLCIGAKTVFSKQNWKNVQVYGIVFS